MPRTVAANGCVALGEAAYTAAITAAARRLVEDRLMLEEDIERAVALAQNWGRPRHEVGLE